MNEVNRKGDVVPLPTALDARRHRRAAARTGQQQEEQVLRSRERQQAAVAQLGQLALAGTRLPTLMDLAAALAARTLKADTCAVLELLPEGGALLVRAGAGWKKRHVGRATIAAGLDSQAGYALLHGEPVNVEDWSVEARFRKPRVLDSYGIVSSLTVIIHSRGRPFGVLAAGSTERRTFSAEDVNFLQTVANVLAEAIERERAEEALRESNRHLEDALSELRRTQQQIIQQERLRALGQMAAGITHDFNNALSFIVGFSELLLQRPDYLDDPQRLRQYLEYINTAAVDATDVVGRLREFYRQREPGETLRAVNLGRIAEHAIALTRPKWKDQAQASGVTIRIETDLQQAPPAAGNEAELREALTNLIFNAVDAMPKGGQLTIRSRAEGEQVVLEVSDTGVGMTEKVRQHCLDPFFTTKGERGTGLGLAMVYGTVRRHEGTLELKSRRGRGTTAIIRLPLAGPATSTEARASPIISSSRPLRVLVVNDEPALRQLLMEYLSADGHLADQAGSGREAIRKLRGGDFDLVVADSGMPPIAGHDLALAVKRTRPTVPVMLLTGSEDVGGEKPAGVDTVLAKPVTPTVLRQALATLFRAPGGKVSRLPDRRAAGRRGSPADQAG